jgi:hypothetical protein
MIIVNVICAVISWEVARTMCQQWSWLWWFNIGASALNAAFVAAQLI